MRLDCPFCGERSLQEFIYRGDAAPARPSSDDGFADYTYFRDNVAGVISEHWYHAQGCRRWLRVRRDTTTHAVVDVVLAGRGAR
jgi:heterotetrameric sarcosine oxidase delta subunit